VPLLPLAAGCVTYTAQDVSAMSGERLCELETVYRASLPAESRQRVRAEITRRNEDCGKHAAAIKARLDQELHDAMYHYTSP
jgi:hypothetical protein